MLPIIDIIFLLFLSGFLFYGLFFGLIKSVGNLVGVIVGTWVASRVYLIFFGYVADLAMGYENLGKILSFIICFTIVNRLIGLLFAILDRTYNLLTIIPFLKTVNRLAGAIFGLIQGALILGLLLYIIARYVPEGTAAANILMQSKFAPYLLNFANVITPLLPELVQKIKAVI